MKREIEIPAGIQQGALDNLAGSLTAIIIWAVIGFAVIWVISLLGEGALQKFRPVAVFLVVAGFAGFLLMRVVNGSA